MKKIYRLKQAHTFNKLGITLLALGAVVVLGACASTQPASEQLSDSAITAKVEAKLAADPEVNPFEIDVDTNEGVVRLSGSVEEPGDRSEAVKLATNTQGVKRVINDITIGDSTMSEHLDDAAITMKVKTKLAADPEINPFNIDVDCKDGVVTLSGRVAKIEASREAEKLARNTTGVRQVKNLVEVGKE
ncbi:MAG: BON domain-containing protein [Thermoanaerobaculia bacterium]|nr:BON domain-containing protein [Thermoanaerobaculia bacterium]